MPRGGYQSPANPAPVSGPGKFSKRTDGGAQPIKEPSIDDPTLEYGDRGRLTDAQRIAHAAAGQGASVTGRRPTGSVGSGTKLPPWLFQGDSERPGEPGSAGLGMGPGPGPEALQAAQPADDVREQVLEYLAQNFGSPGAVKMLTEIRNEKAAATGPGAAPAVAASTLVQPFTDEAEKPGTPEESPDLA